MTKWNEEKAVLIESLKNWSVDSEEEEKPNVKNEFIMSEKMEPQESDYEMDMQSETSDECIRAKIFFDDKSIEIQQYKGKGWL